MDITRVHQQTVYSNEVSYYRSAWVNIELPINETKVIAYRPRKGLWLTLNYSGYRLKKGLSDGALGVESFSRSGHRYLEYTPYTPTPEEPEKIAPTQIENYSIVLLRFTDSPAPPCDRTFYFFGNCKCNPSCYPSPYETQAACATNTLTAQWITVGNAYEPASDGSCRYQPNGGWLFCDEDPFVKFPGYLSVQTPFRYSYQSFSQGGWYQSSSDPPFPIDATEAERTAQGWQRYIPGNMWRNGDTLVIFHRESVSACDTPPGAPGLPATVTGPAIWGSQSCTLFSTSGSPFTNSTENQPLSTAPEPDEDPPTRGPSFSSGMSGSQSFIHLYGPKARKRHEVRFNPGERVTAFAIATQNNAYMILRSGFVSTVSNDYYKLRIYRNNQLISETINPVLPNFEDLGISDLWNIDYINYNFNPTTPTNPCASYPIQFKNLANRQVYVAQVIDDGGPTYIKNLNNNNQPEVVIDVFETSGPSCELTLKRSITKKLANYNSNFPLQAVSVSFYPGSADP